MLVHPWFTPETRHVKQHKRCQRGDVKEEGTMGHGFSLTITVAHAWVIIVLEPSGGKASTCDGMPEA